MKKILSLFLLMCIGILGTAAQNKLAVQKPMDHLQDYKDKLSLSTQQLGELDVIYKNYGQALLNLEKGDKSTIAEKRKSTLAERNNKIKALLTEDQLKKITQIQKSEINANKLKNKGKTGAGGKVKGKNQKKIVAFVQTKRNQFNKELSDDEKAALNKIRQEKTAWRKTQKSKMETVEKPSPKAGEWEKSLQKIADKHKKELDTIAKEIEAKKEELKKAAPDTKIKEKDKAEKSFNAEQFLLLSPKKVKKEGKKPAKK